MQKQVRLSLQDFKQAYGARVRKGVQYTDYGTPVKLVTINHDCV